MSKPIPAGGFIGANLANLAFYPDTLPGVAAGAAQQLIRDQITGLKNAGVCIVRIFASYNGLTTAQCVQRLVFALDALAARGMFAIICLDDSYSAGGLFITGTVQFHTANGGHVSVNAFRAAATPGGAPTYRAIYRQHATEIVQATHNHPATLFYELGNEYQIHASGNPTAADAEAFLDFCATMTAALRQIAPILIGTGLVCAKHVYHDIGNRAGLKAYAKRLYRYFDVLSMHYYKDEYERTGGHAGDPINIVDEINFERTIAQELQLISYVGEIGADCGDGSRTAWVDQQAQSWCNQPNTLALLVWSVNTLSSMPNLADTRGVSNGRDSDYTSVTHIVQTRRNCHDTPTPRYFPIAPILRPTAPVRPVPVAHSSGLLVCPATGARAVTTEFLQNITYGTQVWQHRGVDLGGAPGSPIIASAGGIVSVYPCTRCTVGHPSMASNGVVGAAVDTALNDPAWGWGFGNLVVVSTAVSTLPQAVQDAIQTGLGDLPTYINILYAHLSQINVMQDDTIQPGASIGAMGETGNTAGVHLHVEIRAGNQFRVWTRAATRLVSPRTIIDLSGFPGDAT